MNRKTLFATAVCIVLAVVLGLTPFGVQGAMEVQADNDAVVQRMEQASNRLSSAEAAVVAAVNDANSARSFDVYYGDLDNLGYAFTSLGIEIIEVVEVYPMDGFREGVAIVSGDTPAAVRYTLEADSVMTIFGVLEQMELPVYSIIVDGDTRMDVTFLTGGTL